MLFSLQGFEEGRQCSNYHDVKTLLKKLFEMVSTHVEESTTHADTPMSSK